MTDLEAIDQKLDLVLEKLHSLDRRMTRLEMDNDIIRDSFLRHRDRLACLERDRDTATGTPPPLPLPEPAGP